MGINYSPKIVTDGLVLCLDAGNPLSYTSGDSVWKDLSGNNYDAVLVGPTFQNSYFTFDGINDYCYLKNINYGANTKTISELTVTAFIRTSYNNNSNLGDGLSQNSNWAIIDFDRSEVFNLYIEGGGQLKFSGRSANAGGFPSYYDLGAGTGLLVNDGNWHQVGVTFSVSNQKIIFYIDGIKIRELEANGNMTALGYGALRYGIIGDGSEATSENGAKNNIFYDGDIALIKMYDTNALTESQILQNYLATKGRFGL